MRESLSVTDKGKTANTIDNCRIVFCCDPLLRDAIRLNLLTDRVDIVRDLGWRRNTSALTDTDVKYLLLYFEQNYELTSEKKITAALSIVANEIVYYDEAKIPDGAYLFYKHSNLDSKGDFDEYVNELKKNSYFDSNISLEYGDELLTLVTCDYVQENSRLVVVAKKIN